MFCKSCGARMPEDARFCSDCGAAVPRPEPRPGWGAAPPGQGGGADLSGGGFGGGPTGGPGGNDRKWLWTTIAALVVVIVAVAVTVPLVLYRSGGDEEVTETTAATTSTTKRPQQTTTSRTKPTSPPTTAAPETPVGDSAGYWTEIDPLSPFDVRDEPFMTAVSDECLVLLSRDGNSYRIHVYEFESKTFKTIVAPRDEEIYYLDVDKSTIVWWQGRCDEESGGYLDQRIYSYEYPDGPLIDVAGARPNLSFPQTAGVWVTWVQGGPWESAPDEYWRVPIYGAFTSTTKGSANEPQLLVPQAVTSLMGDADWTYSLSETHLAWEQWIDDGGLAAGSYVLDLMAQKGRPVFLGATAWRPSVAGTRAIYWDEDYGLRSLDLESGERVTLDENGDFGVAAPTFAVYYRVIEDSAGPSFEIVARGYTGAHKQVLAEQWDPPWFSAPISTSEHYVAFVADSALRVFEWRQGVAPRGPSAGRQSPPATPIHIQ